MQFISHLRYACRMLRLNPGFASVAVVTLALGIGATTAMFSVLDGVVLKGLRYPDAERIVAVNTRFTDSGRSIWRMTGGDQRDLRADRETFEAFSVYTGSNGEMGVQLAKGADFVGAYLVDGEFFRVFSAPMLAGRPLAAGDAGRAAVVGARFAQRQFGSAAGALGQTLGIEGTTYEIVGVAPAMFDFPRRTEVWAAFSPANDSNRNSFNYRGVAKLRPGVSLAAANARLQALGSRLAADFPADNRDKGFSVTSLQEQLSAPVRTTLLVLMGAVGLVLLIACANVANLMLARATARSRELAVRAALGAGRGQLMAQLLAESIVLATAAAALGLAMAEWGTKALLALGARFVPGPLLDDIRFDWRVLAFALAAGVLTSVLFGIAPAWQATRVNLQDALKQGGSRGLLGAGPATLRNSLVVAQIALSLTLAVGAGLLFRTMLALENADLGYHTESMLVTYAHAPARTLPAQLEAGRFFDEFFARLRALPGVTAAAGAMGVPATGNGSNGSYAIEGKHSFSGELRKLPQADFTLASPGYFAAMGMRLLRGRDFSEGDLYDAPFVVIISESVARREFGGDDPLGHRIQCGLDTLQWMTVVGVVSDIRQDSPAAPPGPALYMPLRQHPSHGHDLEVVVRTAGNPEALMPAIQNVVRQMNPEVATKFTTLRELVSDSIGTQRFRAVLASSFAGLALMLALSGMYAVMSYVTARRTSEFGLRSALGAQPRNIVGLVLGGAVRLAAVGVCAGLALSLAASRLLGAMMFGLKSTDPVTFTGVIAVVAPVIVVAAAVPAWRASRVDPMIALRNE